MRNHGHSKTYTYASWEAMRARCKGNHPSRAEYGDKGIDIDPSWDSYLQFLADMGERPPGASLDRIDGSRGYSKENCRWATRKQQNQNTSRNRKFHFRGELLCISEIARLTGIKERTLHWRLSRGVPIDVATQKQSFLTTDPASGKFVKTISAIK